MLEWVSVIVGTVGVILQAVQVRQNWKREPPKGKHRR